MPEKYSAVTDLSKKVDLLSIALTNAGIGTWSLDPVNEIVHWDQRCRELFGFGKEEIVQYDRVLDYVFADDRELVRQAVTQALDFKSGGAYETHFRTVDGDGQLRWLHCKGLAYFNEVKAPYLFAGTASDITHIIKLREKEQALSRHFQLALQSANAGSFKIFSDSLLEYTPLLKKIFTGESEGEITRDDLIRHIHPDDVIIRQAAYESATLTGYLDYEARVIWNDGTIRWVTINGTYQYDHNGKPEILSGIALDITEAKLGRLAIEANELRFRMLIEQAPIATCLFIGKNMNIAVANEQMIKYWGKGWSVMEKPLLEALPELKGQPFFDILSDIYETGKTYQAKAARAELIIDGKLGTYYFDFTYKPILDAHGNVYGIMDMAVDVTAQVKAQIRAEAVDVALRSAIEIGHIDTWEIDPITKIITYSHKIKQWIGSEHTSNSLDDFLEFIDEGDREAMRSAFAKFSDAAGMEPYDIEYAVINKQTGVKKILHSRGKAILGNDQVPVKVIGITQDISEQVDIRLSLEQLVQVRTEELAASNEELAASNEELISSLEDVSKINNTLSRSNQELEQYAYAASHDLQEPLRKIQTFADRLKLDNRLDVKASDYLQKIIDSAKRMSLLIHDLLNFSRLQVQESAFDTVDLGNVLNEIVQDLEINEAGETTITIEALPVLEGVTGQLTQLFYNLLSNAIKFKSPDRLPKISVSSKEITPSPLAEHAINLLPGTRYFEITVQDNGIGFSEEYAKQIFEIFKRLHTRAAFPGSGIGLALCKRITANHHGYITVESVVNAGSAFHIVLPERQA